MARQVAVNAYCRPDFEMRMHAAAAIAEKQATGSDFVFAEE
jgi:hypothetical protein